MVTFAAGTPGFHPFHSRKQVGPPLSHYYCVYLVSLNRDPPTGHLACCLLLSGKSLTAGQAGRSITTQNGVSRTLWCNSPLSPWIQLLQPLHGTPWTVALRAAEGLIHLRAAASHPEAAVRIAHTDNGTYVIYSYNNSMVHLNTYTRPHFQ